MSDEDYRLLQLALLLKPDKGAIIRGGGGVRKMRWSLPGQGKRGGARVIYYWSPRHAAIIMLWMYRKNEQEDLTKDQLKRLRQVVEAEYK